MSRALLFKVIDSQGNEYLVINYERAFRQAAHLVRFQTLASATIHEQVQPGSWIIRDTVTLDWLETPDWEQPVFQPASNRRGRPSPLTLELERLLRLHDGSQRLHLPA